MWSSSYRLNAVLILISLSITAIALFALGRPEAARAQRQPAKTPIPPGPIFCGVTSHDGKVRLQLSQDERFVLWMEFLHEERFVSTRERCNGGVAPINEAAFIFKCDASYQECRNVNDPTPRATYCPVAPCGPGREPLRPTATPRIVGYPTPCRAPCRAGEPRYPTRVPTSRPPNPPGPNPPGPKPQDPPPEPPPPGRPGGCPRPPCFLPAQPAPQEFAGRLPMTERRICNKITVEDVVITGKVLSPDFMEGSYTFFRERITGKGSSREREVGFWQAWHPAVAPCP